MNKNEILHKYYYDPNTGFVGAKPLFNTLLKNNVNNISLGDVKAFIKKQNINQLIDPNPTGSFIPTSINQQLQIDLIDFSGNDTSRTKLNNGRYGFVGINSFTKKAHIYLMKKKTEDESIKGLLEILKILGIPKTIYTDREASFKSKGFQTILNKNSITHIFAKQHAPIVERFNRTIKTRIYKYLLSTNTKTITNVLNKFVNNYNSTIHSMTGFKPNEINKSNMHLVQFNLIKNLKKPKHHSKINVGDSVRFLKVYDSTRKGFDAKYSKRIFIIEAIKNKQYYLDGMTHPFIRSSLLKIEESQENTQAPDIEGTLEGRLKTKQKIIYDHDYVKKLKDEMPKTRKSTRVKKETKNDDFMYGNGIYVKF